MNPHTADHSIPLQKNSLCARCSSPFRCGSIAGDTHCHCDDLTLTEQTLAYLRERYAGCLCGNCLDASAEKGPAADIIRNQDGVS